MPGSARQCSIDLPTRLTSSKPDRSRIAFAGHCGRNAKSDPWRRRRSILLPLRPTGYAPAERNAVLLTFNVPGVGQIKPPKWAKPTCQKQKLHSMLLNTTIPATKYGDYEASKYDRYEAIEFNGMEPPVAGL